MSRSNFFARSSCAATIRRRDSRRSSISRTFRRTSPACAAMSRTSFAFVGFIGSAAVSATVSAPRRSPWCRTSNASSSSKRRQLVALHGHARGRRRVHGPGGFRTQLVPDAEPDPRRPRSGRVAEELGHPREDVLGRVGLPDAFGELGEDLVRGRSLAVDDPIRPTARPGPHQGEPDREYRCDRKRGHIDAASHADEHERCKEDGDPQDKHEPGDEESVLHGLPDHDVEVPQAVPQDRDAADRRDAEEHADDEREEGEPGHDAFVADGAGRDQAEGEHEDDPEEDAEEREPPDLLSLELSGASVSLDQGDDREQRADDHDQTGHRRDRFDRRLPRRGESDRVRDRLAGARRSRPRGTPGVSANPIITTAYATSMTRSSQPHRRDGGRPVGKMRKRKASGPNIAAKPTRPTHAAAGRRGRSLQLRECGVRAGEEADRGGEPDPGEEQTDPVAGLPGRDQRADRRVEEHGRSARRGSPRCPCRGRTRSTITSADRERDRDCPRSSRPVVVGSSTLRDDREVSGHGRAVAGRGADSDLAAERGERGPRSPGVRTRARRSPGRTRSRRR